jgi:hypothetical protein
MKKKCMIAIAILNIISVLTVLIGIAVIRSSIISSIGIFWYGYTLAELVSGD